MSGRAGETSAKIVVETEGVRADQAVARALPGRGRKAVAEAFAAGRVRVNGKKAAKGDRLRAGDVVEVAGEVVRAADAAPAAEPELPLEVVHEDPRLVVVAKPAGMTTHPLAAGERGTLAGAVLARHPECAAASATPREGGAAHRLDAGTSGLVVFARDRAAWDALRAAFHEGRVKKTYLALVRGVLTREGELDAAIAQAGGRAVVCATDEAASARGALPAYTRWKPVKRLGAYTLLECEAETGRMHQVRAHLAHAGWPIVGDELYGSPAPGDPPVVGFFLHAKSLEIPHPDGKTLRLEAPLPADREAALAALQAR